MSFYNYWPPYVSVAEKKRKAAQKLAALKKKGLALEPVQAEGRLIARTFWGQAWCRNLESYSDYSNRLPRGRTYLRNGSVLDLKIAKGKISALVQGSSLYKIDISIGPTAPKEWKNLVRECAGKIDSLIELLQGRFSKNIMEVMTRPDTGLFPRPKQIELSCSCPDWAEMCKHVAAVLYGVGTRLDEKPELLFSLRQVDHEKLIGSIDMSKATQADRASDDETLDAEGLGEIFGIDLEPQKPPQKKKAAPKRPLKKTISKKRLPRKSASNKKKSTPGSKRKQAAKRNERR